MSPAVAQLPPAPDNLIPFAETLEVLTWLATARTPAPSSQARVAPAVEKLMVPVALLTTTAEEPEVIRSAEAPPPAAMDVQALPLE